MGNVVQYNANGAAGYVAVHSDSESKKRMEYRGKRRSIRVDWIASISALEERKRCPVCISSKGKLQLTRKHNCFENFICKECKTRYELNIITEQLTPIK